MQTMAILRWGQAGWAAAGMRGYAPSPAARCSAALRHRPPPPHPCPRWPAAAAPRRRRAALARTRQPAPPCCLLSTALHPPPPTRQVPGPPARAVQRRRRRRGPHRPAAVRHGGPEGKGRPAGLLRLQRRARREFWGWRRAGGRASARRPVRAPAPAACRRRGSDGRWGLPCSRPSHALLPRPTHPPAHQTEEAREEYVKARLEAASCAGQCGGAHMALVDRFVQKHGKVGVGGWAGWAGRAGAGRAADGRPRASAARKPHTAAASLSLVAAAGGGGGAASTPTRPPPLASPLRLSSERLGGGRRAVDRGELGVVQADPSS